MRRMIEFSTLQKFNHGNTVYFGKTKDFASLRLIPITSERSQHFPGDLGRNKVIKGQC